MKNTVNHAPDVGVKKHSFTNLIANAACSRGASPAYAADSVSQGEHSRQHTDSTPTAHRQQRQLPRFFRYVASILFLLCFSIGSAWGADYTIYQATSSGVNTANFEETGIAVSFNSMKTVSNSPVTSVANAGYGIEAGLKAPKWGGSGEGKNIQIVVAENYTATITAYVQVNTVSQTVTVKETSETGTNKTSVSCSATETVYQVQASGLAAGTYYIKATDKVGLIKLVASVTASGDPEPSCDDATVSFSATSTAIEIAEGESSASTTLSFSSDNESTAVYAVTKGGAATSDASVTGTTFTATAKGTYVVTVTQAKDETNNICAVEKTVTITVTDANVVPPTCEGLLFKVEVTTTPASTVKVPKSGNGGVLDLADYVTITNGVSAKMYNTNSNDYDAVTTTPALMFKDNAKEYLELKMNCELAEGDIIIFTNSKNREICFSATTSPVTSNVTVGYKYVIPAGSALIGKSTIYVFRIGNDTDIKSLSINRPHVVTLNTEGGTCAATEVACIDGDKVVLPHAFKKDADPLKYYYFKGWYEVVSGGNPVANYYAAENNIELHAQYKDIPASGDLFTLSMSNALKPTTEDKLAKAASTSNPTSLDLLQYAEINGGSAVLYNKATGGQNASVTTTPGAKLSGADGYIVVNLDFPLVERDVITGDVTNTIWITTANARPSSTPAGAAIGKTGPTDVTVTTESLAGATTLYIWQGGSSLEVKSLKITRPVTYQVSFNMHGHGDQVDSQSLLEGDKVTAPATTDIDGWDFGGWYQTYVASPESYSNAWDFANDVVGTSAIVLHAKWTAHVTSADASLASLTANGISASVDPLDATKYTVELPMGTSVAPDIVATPTDDNAEATVASNTLAEGATIVVVPESGEGDKVTYTLSYTIATSKDIELVWATDNQRCDGTKPSAKALIATASTYLSASYTGTATEGGSLNTGKTTGSKITITAKPGYAFQAMSFYGKIEDGTCNFYKDGVSSTIGTATSDKCYDVFTTSEVHEFAFELTGSKGIYIRNMQLTIVEACTPKTIAWSTEPAAEYEVGKSATAIAATANNGTVAYATSDGDVIAVNASTGALTVSALGTVTLSASVPAGDGTTYCNEGAGISKANVKTYYLVQFDAQNGDAVSSTKYYSGDGAIALPSTPSFTGHTFRGWFDAATGGTAVTSAITPTASRIVYAQWEAECAGPTITTQPVGANYLTGRAAAALSCEATAGNGGALTYTWYSCDDELRTNPVELAGAPTPSTAIAGTFYYFCAVTEEGCAVVANSDVAEIVVADKDPIYLVWADVDADRALTYNASKSKVYTEEEVTLVNTNVRGQDSGVTSGCKFQSNSSLQVSLKEASFQAGDIVEVYVTKEANDGGAQQMRAFEAASATEANVIAESAENMVLEENRIALTGTTADIYLIRGGDYTHWNPHVLYVAVGRVSAPILNKITVNGIEGTPNASNEIAIEVPATTTQSQLEAITYDWVSNNDAWTEAHAPIATNAWEFGVQNTVTFTDKDGDASVYYVTVTKAAAIDRVEISGTLSVMEDATTTLSAVVYDTNDAEASIQDVTWTSDAEGVATVENGVVSAVAIGTAHITATSVADGTKSKTVEVTVTENMCRAWSNPTAINEVRTIGKMKVTPVSIGEYKTDAIPYQGASATKVWKLDSRDTKYAEVNFTDNAQIESLIVGVTSNSTSTGLQFAVAFSTKAGDKFAEGFISAAAYEANAKNKDEALVDVIVPAGAKVARILRQYRDGSTDIGGSSSVYLYYINACKKELVALTSVAVADKSLAVGVSGVPAVTLTPANADVASYAWEIVSDETGAATINATTGVVSSTATGSVTVRVTATDELSNEVVSNVATITIVNKFVDVKPVAETTTWSWSGIASENIVITDVDTVLANYYSGAQWEHIAGKAANDQYAYRAEYDCYQGTYLFFKTTVPGMLTINARYASSGAKIVVNGNEIAALTQDYVNYSVAIPAGNVKIEAKSQKMRIKTIKFDTDFCSYEIADNHFNGYTRTMNQGFYGTICLPNGGVMVGATIYEVAHMTYENNTPYKVFFDEVLSGEMVAGRPYIFQPREGVTQLGVFYTDEENATAGDYRGLHGTLEYMDGAALNGKYIFSNNTIFMSTNPGNWLNANRAYIVLSEVQDYESAPAPGRRRIAMGVQGAPQVATDVEDVQAPTDNIRKVLIDGELFILRGEKTFDATGRLVK